MPRYRVRLSNGESVVIEAPSPSAAEAWVMALRPAPSHDVATPVEWAQGRGAPSGEAALTTQPDWADAIRALANIGTAETAGGLVGGALGGLAGGSLVVPGAMGGAALARYLRGQTLEDETPGESAIYATGHGLLEGVPVIGKGLIGTGRYLMNAALKPGLRVVNPVTKEVITGAPRNIATRFPGVDVTEEILQRGRPVRNAGLLETQEQLGKARRRAVGAVEEYAASRPRVAGLLPEGRVDVPLGPTPTPTGGRGATPLADVSQFRRQSESTRLQGMDPDDPLDPIFGGGPRAAPPLPQADVVAGPGVIRRTFSEAGVHPPTASLIPGQSQMVGVEEALAAAREELAGMARTALPARKRKLGKLIEEYAAEYPDPADVVLAQRRKDVSADEAAKIYGAEKGAAGRKGAATAQFHEMLAKGNRQAVEARVPNIRALNAATQQELAIRDALKEALDREARSSRFTLAGLIDNPRLLGALARPPYRLGGPIASQFSPGTLRLLESLMPSHEPERRQITPPR